MRTRNVVIAMGRCSEAKQAYGIRFERQGANQWLATWAFPIKEALAKKEGYEETRMDGQFSLDSAFPGCPHCTARGFFLCGCGKLACWAGEEKRFTCPWCGRSGELTGEITSIDGSGDR